MTSKAGVGFSERPNSREAAVEATKAALEQAGTNRCDVVLLFATLKHDPILLREGVRSVVGDAPRLFGGSAAGVITNHRLGYEGYQVGVAVIDSDSIQVDAFIEKGLRDNEYNVGRGLGAQLREKSGGVANLLLLYDIVKQGAAAGGMSMNMATPLLQGMTEELGEWPPTAGCGMLGGMQWLPTFQWFEGRIEEQSAMALVFSGDVKFDTVMMHGCRPSSAYYKITKAENNNVLELDGRPTLDVVDALLGSDSDKGWKDYPLFVTLGINNGDMYGEYREDDYAVRLCMDVDRERKGLLMFGDDLTEGRQVQIMRRSIDFQYIKNRSKGLLDRLDGRKPLIAFYIDCAGRTSAFSGTEREDAEEVQKIFGADIPLLGWYVGCEIAKAGPSMQSHNWTGVLCVLSE